MIIPRAETTACKKQQAKFTNIDKASKADNNLRYDQVIVEQNQENDLENKQINELPLILNITPLYNVHNYLTNLQFSTPSGLRSSRTSSFPLF